MKTNNQSKFIYMHILIKYLAVHIFIFFVNASLTAQNYNTNQPWFFIQLSDPQIGMFEKNKGFEKETVLFEKAVNHINRLQPEFVVITGDFVHDQNSERQINEFKRIVAKINSNIPVYLVPGNHDVGQIPDKQSLKDYRKNYGKDRFVFKHKGSVFIGFNSGLIKGSLKKMEQKQYKWLVRTLKRYQDAQHIILFCHYPFFNKNIDEPESYSNIGPEYRRKYLSLFDSNNVSAVFSGHLHDNMLNRFKKIQLVTTGALGKPLGEAPSGMRIIKVYKEEIQHEYYEVNRN